MNHDIGDNQGRIGLASTNASRAIFGLQPLPDPEEALLWQRSGGARVHNGVGLHFDAEDEAADEPPETPITAAGRLVVTLKVGFLLIALVVAAFVEHYLNTHPH